MKKIRILAVILAVLMLPLSLFVACDKKDGDGTDLCPNNAHKYGPRQIVSRRSCTTPEVIRKKCVNCSYVQEERKEPLGHKLEDPISDNNATCTEDGTKSKRCSCGYFETIADPGSKLGHTYVTYTKVDEFTEESVCIRCGDDSVEAKDYREIGLLMDFETPKNHPSYDRLAVFAESAGAYLTEGEGEEANSYLSIKKEAGVIIGSSEFGVILAPRADVLKGITLEDCPSYIVEFKVRVTKNGTKDLVLLKGEKNGVTETFLTYDSANGTINSNIGTVYALADADYANWLKVAVRLNDGKMNYDVYINDVLVTDVAVSYKNISNYFMGYDLESLKIVTVSGEEASSFDIDDIKMFVGDKPLDYKDEAKPGYGVCVLSCNSNVVYKLPTCESCTFGDADVVAPTCVRNGYSVKTCTACGGQEITDAENRESHDWGTEAIVNVAASCTVSAYKTYECSKCNQRNIIYDETQPALGHEINTDPTTGYGVFAPTCFKEGYTKGVCSREGCGIDLKIDIKPALGHTLTEGISVDYVRHEVTCTDPQYAEGKCDRFGEDGCDKVFTLEDEMEYAVALEHEINTEADDYVHVAATCVTPGYSTGKCVRFDACGYTFVEADLPEEVLGHRYYSSIQVVDGVNKVASTCIGCGITSLRELYNEYPTPDEMTGLVSDKTVGTAAATNSKYNFQGFNANDTFGDLGGTSLDGFKADKSSLTVKEDMGNKYAEWMISADTSDTYINLPTKIGGGAQDGVEEDFVFEFSIRKIKGVNVLPLAFRAIERTTTSPNSADHYVLNNKGHIRGAGHVFGVISEDEWTRVAIVFHANPGQDSAPSTDLYINGELRYQDWIFESSTVTQEFPDYTEVRLQATGKNGEMGIAIDEVYIYYGDAPLYVTNTNGINFTDMVFTDTSANTGTVESADGSMLSYIKPGTLGGETLFEGAGLNSGTITVTLGAGANTIYAAENVGTADAPEYGMHIQMNSTLPSITEAEAGNSYISVTGKGIASNRTFCFDTDMKIIEGTSGFDILTSVRDDKSYVYLKYSDGKIYSGDTEIMTVTYGEWFNIAVTLNEHTGIYNIFVDGEKVKADMVVPDDYQIGAASLPKKLSYKIFVAHETSETGTYDVYYKDTGLYSGHYLPDAYIRAQIALLGAGGGETGDETGGGDEVA